MRVLTYRCTSSLSIFLSQNKDERGLETTPGIHVIRVASLRRVQRKRVTWTCPRSHVACPEGSLLPYNEGAQFFSCSLDSSTVEEPTSRHKRKTFFFRRDIFCPLTYRCRSHCKISNLHFQRACCFNLNVVCLSRDNYQ